MNCPARSRTRNRNSAARSPRSISKFRACCTVHAPSGCAVTPRTCIWRVPTSITKEHVQAAQGYRAVDVEEIARQHRRGLRLQETVARWTRCGAAREGSAAVSGPAAPWRPRPGSPGPAVRPGSAGSPSPILPAARSARQAYSQASQPCPVLEPHRLAELLTTPGVRSRLMPGLAPRRPTPRAPAGPDCCADLRTLGPWLIGMPVDHRFRPYTGLCG